MIKRIVPGALALAAGAAMLVAPSASAAVGSTVSNGGVSAYATSACSAGRIYATVHMTSRKNNQYLEVRGAALYDGNYGSSYYAQRSNAAGITPAAQDLRGSPGPRGRPGR